MRERNIFCQPANDKKGRPRPGELPPKSLKVIDFSSDPTSCAPAEPRQVPLTAAPPAIFALPPPPLQAHPPSCRLLLPPQPQVFQFGVPPASQALLLPPAQTSVPCDCGPNRCKRGLPNAPVL